MSSKALVPVSHDAARLPHGAPSMAFGRERPTTSASCPRLTLYSHSLLVVWWYTLSTHSCRSASLTRRGACRSTTCRQERLRLGRPAPRGQESVAQQDHSPIPPPLHSSCSASRARQLIPTASCLADCQAPSCSNFGKGWAHARADSQKPQHNVPFVGSAHQEVPVNLRTRRRGQAHRDSPIYQRELSCFYSDNDGI